MFNGFWMIVAMEMSFGGKCVLRRRRVFRVRGFFTASRLGVRESETDTNDCRFKKNVVEDQLPSSAELSGVCFQIVAAVARNAFGSWVTSMVTSAVTQFRVGSERNWAHVDSTEEPHESATFLLVCLLVHVMSLWVCVCVQMHLCMFLF